MTFAERLRELKEDSGMTWEEIAYQGNLRERQLYRWVSGERKPRKKNVEKLAKVFGVETSTLVPGGGDRAASTE